MKTISFDIAGPVGIEPDVFEDERGFFVESWNRKRFQELGFHTDFVQDNHSYSRFRNTLRGLHFQAPPYAQAKLVRCTRGAIFDVAIDIRQGSTTYGKWITFELSSENHRQLFIPTGFLHGFLTLTPDAEVQYKCAEFYSPTSEGSVLWDSLDIDWPLEGRPLLAKKDSEATPFDEFVSPFSLGIGA